MDSERGSTEAQLLAHAERQTKALENIQSALMILLALAILSAVVGFAMALNS